MPDMVSLGQPPVTAQTYVEAYLADLDKWWWSTTYSSRDERDIALKRVLAIIKRAQLPDNEVALGQLGAGPLEDMMGNELLDDLTPWMPFTAAMCYALGCVGMHNEPTTLQRRLNAMIQESQRDRTN